MMHVFNSLIHSFIHSFTPNPSALRLLLIVLLGLGLLSAGTTTTRRGSADAHGRSADAHGHHSHDTRGSSGRHARCITTAAHETHHHHHENVLVLLLLASTLGLSGALTLALGLTSFTLAWRSRSHLRKWSPSIHVRESTSLGLLIKNSTLLYSLACKTNVGYQLQDAALLLQSTILSALASFLFLFPAKPVHLDKNSVMVFAMHLASQFLAQTNKWKPVQEIELREWSTRTCIPSSF